MILVGCVSPQPLSLLLLYAKLRPQAAMPYRPPIRPYSARAIVRLVQDSLTNLLDTGLAGPLAPADAGHLYKWPLLDEEMSRACCPKPSQFDPKRSLLITCANG